MEITFENILLPEGTFKVEVIKYIEEDRLRLKNIYYKWRELSTELRSMSGRGINLPEAQKLLINGFLNEIFDNIPEKKIKTFLEKIIEDQIDGI